MQRVVKSRETRVQATCLKKFLFSVLDDKMKNEANKNFIWYMKRSECRRRRRRTRELCA